VFVCLCVCVFVCEGVCVFDFCEAQNFYVILCVFGYECVCVKERERERERERGGGNPLNHV
jgi:hypothetical protein